MADDVAHRQAREQCEEALRSFTGTFVERVRQFVSTGERLRLLPEVAAELSLSPRTFKRRLADQGLTFRALSEEARRDKALVLLRSSLPVSEIAGRLGYSSPANFVRAFRHWTSLPPGAYRRTLPDRAG